MIPYVYYLVCNYKPFTVSRAIVWEMLDSLRGCVSWPFAIAFAAEQKGLDLPTMLSRFGNVGCILATP